MSIDRARGRVKNVVAAGRRIQDPSDVLGVAARARLPECSGLAGESIELALRDHFETNPAESEIDALLDSVTHAPHCHVVLSANVCTAPLRALALAVATSERVFVRPSRRDPVITELLVRALHEDPEFGEKYHGFVEQVTEVRPGTGDELHLYGSDETIDRLTSNLPSGVVVRAHGTGVGIAIVGGATNLEEAAESVARDVVPFDQRGCLSPRFVLVEGDASRAERFADFLLSALDRWGSRIPRGPVDRDLHAEITRYRSTMHAVGSYGPGAHHAVGLDPAPRALVLPPAARIAHVVPANAENVGVLLSPWIRYVTAVGCDDEGALARAVFSLVPGARRSELGRMQTPPLDGPVDRRMRRN